MKIGLREIGQKLVTFGRTDGRTDAVTDTGDSISASSQIKKNTTFPTVYLLILVSRVAGPMSRV